MSLENKFTATQIDKLKAGGIRNLYDFVTFLPLGIYHIVPITSFTNSEKEKTKYLDQAILENLVDRKGKQQPFLQLQWHSQLTNRSYQTYLFSIAKWTRQSLIVGQEFQLILINKNNFWSVEKFAKTGQIQNSSQLVLGRSKIREYLDVYYSKLGFLPSNYVKSLHTKLTFADYQLNLEGLIPANPFVPGCINMEAIHKPTSISQYNEARQQWLSFQFFLKVAVAKYVQLKQKQDFARATVLDVEFLKQTANSLPYSLSVSQKKAIWEILQSLSIKP